MNRITWIGAGCNLALTGMKLVVGYLIGSLALIADGYHSFSDLGTDFVVLLGSRLSNRPPDRSHPFGHGKFETFATWIIALVLVVGGGWVIFEAVNSLMRPAEPVRSGWIIATAAASLVVKEWIFRATMHTAHTCHSSSLKANAWHHRSDALSSLIVLFSGIAGLLGWLRSDAVAGSLVGLMICFIGVKLNYDAMMELSEASPGREIEDRIKHIIGGFREVRGWHRLRIRRIGRELSMDIHILLDSDATIRQGHDITKRIEKGVKEGIDWPINLTIHVEPDTEEVRDASRRFADWVLKG